MDPSFDPVAKLLGWSADSTDVRSVDTSFTVAGIVAVGLLVSVVLLRYTAGELARKFATKDGAPKGEELAKQAAFCIVGMVFHCYLGPAAINAAVLSEGCPWEASVGNRAALEGSQKEWMPLVNYQGIMGEIFMGYAFYITIMWVAGWEEGFDKIVHHIVFLFLSLVLAGNFAYPRLAAFAISMEASTIFLDVNMMSGWYPKLKIVHLLFGVLFILSFIALRIFFFGYGMFIALKGFAENPTAAPIPVPLSALVLFLFSGGWVLQVYWTQKIVAKVKETLGGGKKKSE